jgi:hypothetical protein
MNVASMNVASMRGLPRMVDAARLLRLGVMV